MNTLKWRNRKHADQWTSTLTRYAYPVFGEMAVSAVDIDDVLKVLKPIWLSKTETASRVQGRIEQVLDYAHTRKLREGENPARWRGRLSNALPAPSQIRPVKHHAAMPYSDVPAFLTTLRAERQ